MKIRNGFVSNSSSSSFCLVGIRVGNVKDIDKIAFLSGQKYVMIGNYLYDGIDLIELNESFIEWFSQNKDDSDFSIEDGNIYDVIKISYYEGEMEFNLAEAYNRGYNNVVIVSGTCDENSTRNASEAENRYIK